MRKIYCTVFLILFNIISLVAGQRPDIYSFTSTERTQLRNLIMNYISDPIVSEHMANMNVAHSYQLSFLTWHRDYIGGLENYLRNNGWGQFVPLPSWNPNTSIPSQFRGQTAGLPWPYDATPSGFNFSSFVNSNTMCDFSPGTSNFCFEGQTRITRNSPTSIDAFAYALECEHNDVHVAVGSNMSALMTAPSAAIFWLYHAFIDDIYYEYDGNCNCNNQELWTWNNSPYYGDAFMLPFQWPYSSTQPGNSAFTSSYGWIFLPAGQNACNYGLHFYGTICGNTGWYFDYDFGDGWIYSFAQSSWLNCAGKTDFLSTSSLPIDLEIIASNTNEEYNINWDDYEVFKNMNIPNLVANDIQDLKIIIYPNPLETGTALNIQLSNDKAREISVFDILGRNILTKEATSETIKINTGELTTGIYIIVGFDEKGQAIFKEKVLVE